MREREVCGESGRARDDECAGARHAGARLERSLRRCVESARRTPRPRAAEGRPRAVARSVARRRDGEGMRSELDVRAEDEFSARVCILGARRRGASSEGKYLC